MTLRAADGIGVEQVGHVVYAAPLPDGPITVLDGVAALIWREAQGAPRERVASGVAAATGEDVGSIAAHVDGFLDELLVRGLLLES
jgi:Coenzyme PQQ synthesis protein D (PqqD)